MKKLLMILLAGYALVMGQGVRTVAADDNGTPLRKLAGTYAVTFQESLAQCLADIPPHAPVQCGSTGSIVVPLTILGVGGATFDTAGNFCIPLTATIADLTVGVSPPFVFTFNNMGKITSYDPRTGTGDKSDTNYDGGRCHGATFDSTGATATGTVTSHFAVSNHGKRIDGIVTSLGTDPTVSGFSAPFTFLRQ